MTTIIKSGNLSKYSDTTYSTKWKFNYVELLSNSTFQWFDQKGDKTPKRSINLQSVSSFLAFGDIINQLPFKPDLKGVQMNLMIAIPHENRRDTRLSFFLCNNETELQEWVNSILNTLSGGTSSGQPPHNAQPMAQGPGPYGGGPTGNMQPGPYGGGPPPGNMQPGPYGGGPPPGNMQPGPYGGGPPPGNMQPGSYGGGGPPPYNQQPGYPGQPGPPQGGAPPIGFNIGGGPPPGASYPPPMNTGYNPGCPPNTSQSYPGQPPRPAYPQSNYPVQGPRPTYPVQAAGPYNQQYPYAGGAAYGLANQVPTQQYVIVDGKKRKKKHKKLRNAAIGVAAGAAGMYATHKMFGGFGHGWGGGWGGHHGFGHHGWGGSWSSLDSFGSGGSWSFSD